MGLGVWEGKELLIPSIGKNNTQVLNNNDEIALSFKKNKGNF